MSVADLDAMRAVGAIQNFMRSSAGLMSQTDIRIEMDDSIKKWNECETPIDAWGKIKANQHKQILISKFVSSVSDYYKLSETESDQLDKIIRLGVAVKYFDASNIHINYGIITSIDGLKRNDNGNFVIDS